MAGRVDRISAEAQVSKSNLEKYSDAERQFILCQLDEMDTKYLKRLVNFKRTNKPDGSAVFTMRLNLDNK